MGFLAPKDLSANPAPAAVYNWRIYCLALSAAMGSAMFGYDSAFIGGTLSLPSFKKEFGLDKVSKKETAALSANIVSTFQAGCFFGAIICYAITKKLGRRITLLTCGAVFDIGTILQLASSGKLGLIYAGRAFTGQCSGIPLMV
jgi:MFS family permease